MVEPIVKSPSAQRRRRLEKVPELMQVRRTVVCREWTGTRTLFSYAHRVEVNFFLRN